MIFDDDELILPNQYSNIAIEIEELKKELENIDDISLADEIAHITTDEQFNTANKHLSDYLKDGKMTKKIREVFEGCYILYHSRYVISEDGICFYIIKEF